MTEDFLFIAIPLLAVFVPLILITWLLDRFY